MQSPQLQVIGLAVERGGRRVLANVDFRMDRGEALLLLGPNGAGKSTLLRALAGLLGPSSGEIRWRGSPVGEDPESFRQEIRFLGHQDGLSPALTVAENLRFFAELYGAGAGRIGPALASFALESLADLPTRYLSAGQRRRAALARLALTPAALWLMDEPATGLDAASRAALTDFFARHRAAGGMVIAASHGDVELGQASRLELGRRAA
jgi:heme exporter protein A